MPKKAVALSKLGKYLKQQKRSQRWLMLEIMQSDFYDTVISQTTLYNRVFNLCLGKAKLVGVAEKNNIAKILGCNTSEIFDKQKK